MDSLSNYITSNPKVLGGTATIAGTRIPVNHIKDLIIEGGYSIHNLNEDYPQVGLRKMKKILNVIMTSNLNEFEKNSKKVSFAG